MPLFHFSGVIQKSLHYSGFPVSNFIKIIRCEEKINEAVPTYEQVYSHDNILLKPLKYVHTKDRNLPIVILACLTQPILPSYFSTADKWMRLDGSSPAGSYELPLLLQGDINSVCAAQVTEAVLSCEMRLQNYRLPSHFPVLG